MLIFFDTEFTEIGAPPLVGIYHFTTSGLKLVRLLNGAKSAPKAKEE